MAVIGDDWVFVHAPKTGGTAVASILGGTMAKTFPQHVPYRVLEPEHTRAGFGFIRNPWRLMISLFYFLHQSPPRHLQRVDPAELKRVGFKRWLLDGATYTSNEPIDGMISTVSTGFKYVPVAEAAYPNIDRLSHHKLGLPPMQRRPTLWYLDGCRHIGRQENLQTDLNAFAAALGIWHGIKQIPEMNVTRTKPSGDWRDEYDSETVDHVAHYFAPDIAMGEYRFE